MWMVEPSSTPDEAAAPLYERFSASYPSGTVIPSFYCGGVTVAEVQAAHPLALVEAVEDSRVPEVAP
jgi:hypothetical protein